MNEELNRNCFAFFRSYADCIDACPEEVQLMLYRAVVRYALDLTQPDFSKSEYAGFLNAIWLGISPNLQSSINRYKNGKGGGAPIGNRNASKEKQPKYNQKQPKTNEIEIGIEKEIGDSLFTEDAEAGASTPQHTSKRFVKPTLLDVQQYCASRNNSIDAAKFMDHYESVGWRIGKAPMKDWKAAVRTWERNQQENTPGQTQRREAHPLSKEDLV